ncbi:MAG TPA: hypothetical protein PL048_07020 [Leptospiraceae bacterium]|nr:hypothetical protein [Leptospiraceae bacterium]HMZ58509.1 hypothetical protein [Leptospiraceae bacterium]HNF26597.1 hypothetical protein [Leptospiraceae bacterium]HNH08790.1 hypothetical protein [Leptospiraceae bacterium]HNI99653.1 hypothetical protein [Leptospiraceae bacterium]
MIPFAKSLPHGIEDTLPLLPQLPRFNWKIFYLIFLIALIVWLVMYFRKTQKSKPVLHYLKKFGKDFQVGSEMDDAFRRHTKKETFRAGLDELSDILKAYLEQRFNSSFEELTSEEIGRILNAPEFFRYLKDLDAKRFGSDSPDENEFRDMFEAARKQLKQERNIKMLQGKI